MGAKMAQKQWADETDSDEEESKKQRALRPSGGDAPVSGDNILESIRWVFGVIFVLYVYYLCIICVLFLCYYCIITVLFVLLLKYKYYCGTICVFLLYY